MQINLQRLTVPTHLTFGSSLHHRRDPRHQSYYMYNPLKIFRVVILLLCYSQDLAAELSRQPPAHALAEAGRITRAARHCAGAETDAATDRC